MKKRKQVRKQKGKIEKPKISAATVLSVLPLFISFCSLLITLLSYLSNQDSKPLAYYIRPTVTNTSGSSVTTDVEIIVTNGAVGDVRVLDYRNGQITEIANNVGGVIRSGSSKDRRTLQFQIDYFSTGEFAATQYLLVHGKDGSQNLSLLLYHFNTEKGEIQLRCYSQEELLFAEMDPEQQIYGNVLSDYRNLVEKLKENDSL